MDTALLQRFKDALSQNDRVAILVGKNPNVDEMAAALALYLSLKTSHKSLTIASASQPIVELSSLVGIDEVKASVGASGGDLVVSFPYQEGEIEKVSYTIENGLLNIVVKAGENGLNFQEQDVRFTRGGGVPNLVIVVGTAQLAGLGELYNAETLKDAMIVNIDTKADNDGFGDIAIIAQQYSSVSELMANTILSNGLPMDVDTAQNLMHGISFATNNFQSPTTSYFAFEVVAELMRRGAVRTAGVQAPVQTPSYMQQPQAAPQVRPQQVARPTQNQPVQQPRQNFGQQQPQQQRNGQQNQNRVQQQRPNQTQQPRQHNQNQGSQTSRQDEIRRALAEQARTMQQAQQTQQMNQSTQPVQAQPIQTQPVQPIPEPTLSQPQSDMAQQPTEAPSDWLTPKVYKGSSQPS